MKFASLAVLLLGILPARAATQDEIFAAYAHGEYEQAIEAGQASHTAQGLAVAARAVLAEEVLGDSPCLSCLERAEALSRQAIAADPHYADGHIWLAVALGYESRITGVVEARLKNTPAQSKAALDAAIAAAPDNAYAVSALGGWHIEVVRGGGATLARWVYGARESEALALFDRAVRLAPENVAVHYQIGLALAGFDESKYHGRIVSELRAAIAGTPETAYEKRIQDRANELLGTVNHGPDAALSALVRKDQGYP